MKCKDLDEVNYKEIVQRLDQGVNQLDFKGVHLTRTQLNDLAERVENNPFVGHIIWGAIPNETEDLIEQIENKLIENNKLYKNYPTDFIHGLLSSHSYQTSKVGERVEFTSDSKGTPHINTKYNQYLEDWCVAKVFQPEKADDYYSALYLNDKTHHAILAHRGTDMPGFIIGQSNSVKADLKEILNYNIGVQQAASYFATEEALKIIQNLGYNFSTTGHSLGAWLAELSLYFCHMDFKYPQVKAITFDSPGSKDQMDVLAPNVHNIDTKVRTKQFDIVTYLSAPNIVNVCNQHVGVMYRLAPKIKYPSFLKRELSSLLPEFAKNIIGQNKCYLDSLLSVSGHSLGPMLEVFDPETGTPYPDKYEVVANWPHMKYTVSSTPPIQKLLTGILLHNIPVISSLPNSWKTLDSTFILSSTFLASFLIGDTNILQLCEVFKHLDLNTQKEGYLLSSLDKFALSHKGHYKMQPVNLSKAKFEPILGSIDWYLSQINKISEITLEKNLDVLSWKQLSIVKNGFKIQMNPEHIDKSNILLISHVTQPHNITSIRQLKEYLLRLIKANPTIKEFLEDRVMQQSDITIAQHDELKRDNEEKIISCNSLSEEETISHPVEARRLYSQACNYDAQGNYELALKYYQNALSQNANAAPLFKAQLLYSIACKYDQLKQTKLALENYLKSLIIYNTDDNHHSQTAPILYSIGAKYDELGDNKLALKYYNDALSAYQQLNSPQSSQKIAEILYSIGAKYDDNIEPQKALQYYRKSLKEFWSAKNNIKTMELLGMIEGKCKDLNYLDLGLKCKAQLKIVPVAQKLSLSNNIEQKKKLAIKMQHILEKIGDLTKDGFWNKGFLTSYYTPFYNYGVKGYIDKNYICNQLGLNSNDEDFKIAKILCFEKICTAMSENINSKKSLNCLLEFAKVYPETISAVQATMFYHPENFSDLRVLAKALHLINENVSSAHQDTQVTFPLALILMDIPFHIDEFAEPNKIMIGKEMCSEENILP